MIDVTPQIKLDENELTWTFVRASGPGGQNVNKVSTAAQLRFDVTNSPSLSGYVKARLRQVAGRRMTGAGELIIDARSERSQQRNREDALRRLIDLIRSAAQRPKKRRPTKPSKASGERRIKRKKSRGDTKRLRQRPPTD